MKIKFRLSYYEFKKLFGNKSNLLILLFLLIFNAFNIFKNYDIYSGFSSNYETENGRYELYKAYEGVLDNEKQLKLKNAAEISETMVQSGNYDMNYNPEKYYSGYAYGEAMLRIELNREAERLHSYSDYCDDIVNNALDFYGREDLSEYYKAVNLQIADIYGGRNADYITNNSGVTKLIHYNLSSLIVILLSVSVAVTAFTLDYENNTAIYLKSSHNGGRISTLAKLLSGVIYSIILCVTFFALDFLLFTVILRIDGLNVPLYTLKEFANTPLNIKIWQYLLILFAARILGVIIIYLFSALFSVIIKKSLTALIASAGFTALLMLSKTLFTTGDIAKLNFLNPLNVVLLSELTTDYNAVNIFGTPIQAYAVSFVAAFIVLILLVVAIIIAGGRNVKS